MIRRLFGTVVTLAVLAVVVMTIFHHDRYQSMLHLGESAETTLSVRDTLSEPGSAADATVAGELSSVSPAQPENDSSDAVRTDDSDPAAKKGPAADLPTDSTGR